MTIGIEPPAARIVEYRLTEADVRRYAVSGRFRACGRVCRAQGLGILTMAAIGVSIYFLCNVAGGHRPTGLALASAIGVLIALSWLRMVRNCRRACRLARDLGFPVDVRLTFSPRGIAKDPAADGSEPGRLFAWPEVGEIGRLDHLTVIRLRPAGAVLLIPDRAFPDAVAREKLVGEARAWWAAGRGGHSSYGIGDGR